MIQSSLKIPQIKKQYPNEWLLIKVDAYDQKTLQPLKGRLIAHSPSREAIYKRLITTKGLTTIEFSGPPEKDTVFIF